MQPAIKGKPITLPVDCPHNSNHSYCNGKTGQDCYVFSELRDELEDDMQLTCWENDDVPVDNSRAYCVYNPNAKEGCKIYIKMQASLLKLRVIIGKIIMTFLSSATDFTADNFEAYKPNRAAINSEFDPVKCLFDVFQVQCISYKGL